MDRLTWRRVGLSCRVFIIDGNDSVYPIPYALYEKLMKGESVECFSEYDGKRVRCAVVWVEMARKKPCSIYEIDTILLPFHNKGRIDIREWERKKKARMELEVTRINYFLSSALRKGKNSNLIEAQHRFLRKQYDHKFKWMPNRKIKEEILAHLFRRNKF
jgi:hypothetical protein